MATNLKRRSQILVVTRDSKSAHFEASIIRFDPKCVLKKSSKINVFTILTVVPLEEISMMTSVKTAETLTTFPIKISEVVEFYKINNLMGNEIILLKVHEHAPASFAAIDFDFDHSRFLVSRVDFENPIGPIKMLEDQIALNRGDLELIAEDGKPVIYMSLVSDMIILGSY